MTQRMDMGAFETYILLKRGHAVLIDVRDAAEFAVEHIEGSVNLPLAEVSAAKVIKMAQGRLPIVMCKSGMRSSKACGVLTDVPEMRVLAGGLTYWAIVGLPVARAHQDVWHKLPLERRVQVAVGLLVGVASLLALLINPWFALGSLFIGVGLMNAGVTGWCGMGKILARL